MGENPQIGKWFLKRLFVSPPTWVGLLAGAGAGIAMASKTPLAGAVGFGCLIGFAAGMVAYAMSHGIREAYAMHQEREKSAQKSAGHGSSEKEQALLDELERTDLDDIAQLLASMFQDQAAIVQRAEEHETDTDAAHTVELVSAMIAEACREAEELQDLHRRVNDPILDAPEDAESAVDEIRSGLKRAYQAVADARSRLRRGEKLNDMDFLADPEALKSRDLPALTRQLEEETAIAKRIEDRIRSSPPVSIGSKSSLSEVNLHGNSGDAASGRDLESE